MKNSSNPSFLKVIAFFTVLTFAFTNLTYAQGPFHIPLPSEQSLALPLPEHLSVPEDIGSIQEEYRTKEKSPFIVFIQDAHVVVDAQSNIWNLIKHMQAQYGIRLVALEGGKGRMDPTLLRTFPDESIKRQVMEGYLERGEVTGGELSAVLNEKEAGYFGIEDWKLYEANYVAYLRAMQRKEKIAAELEELKKELDDKRRGVYSEAHNEFHEKVQGFREEKVHLLELLQYLKSVEDAKVKAQERSDELRVIAEKQPEQAAIQPPQSKQHRGIAAVYPHLWILYGSIEKDAAMDKEALDGAVRELAQGFQKKHGREFGKERAREWNRNYQDYVTGSMDAGAYLKYVVSVSGEMGDPVALAPGMRELMGHMDTLATIKGTKLFAELEGFIEEIEERLIKSEEARKIAETYKRALILKDLSGLELSREKLDRLKADEKGYLSLLKNPGLADAGLEFYRLAVARDRALQKNLLDLMKKTKVDSAIVLAGGFHSEGFAKGLKDEGCSYVLVTPRISSLKGHEMYDGVMKGNLSYKDMIKTTFYDAFMRHSSMKLVAELDERDFRKMVKEWRDGVIRKLAEEGRTAEAGEYTKYIDMLMKVYIEKYGVKGLIQKSKEEILKDIEKAVTEYQEKTLSGMWERFEGTLARFSAGAQELIDGKQVTAEKVKDLLQQAANPEVAVSGSKLQAVRLLFNPDPEDDVNMQLFTESFKEAIAEAVTAGIRLEKASARVVAETVQRYAAKQAGAISPDRIQAVNEAAARREFREEVTRTLEEADRVTSQVSADVKDVAELSDPATEALGGQVAGRIAEVNRKLELKLTEKEQYAVVAQVLAQAKGPLLRPPDNDDPPSPPQDPAGGAAAAALDFPSGRAASETQIDGGKTIDLNEELTEKPEASSEAIKVLISESSVRNFLESSTLKNRIEVPPLSAASLGELAPADEALARKLADAAGQDAALNLALARATFSTSATNAAYVPQELQKFFIDRGVQIQDIVSPNSRAGLISGRARELLGPTLSVQAQSLPSATSPGVVNPIASASGVATAGTGEQVGQTDTNLTAALNAKQMAAAGELARSVSRDVLNETTIPRGDRRGRIPREVFDFLNRNGINPALQPDVAERIVLAARQIATAASLGAAGDKAGNGFHLLADSIQILTERFMAISPQARTTGNLDRAQQETLATLYAMVQMARKIIDGNHTARLQSQLTMGDWTSLMHELVLANIGEMPLPGESEAENFPPVNYKAAHNTRVVVLDQKLAPVYHLLRVRADQIRSGVISEVDLFSSGERYVLTPGAYPLRWINTQADGHEIIRPLLDGEEVLHLRELLAPALAWQNESDPQKKDLRLIAEYLNLLYDPSGMKKYAPKAQSLGVADQPGTGKTTITGLEPDTLKPGGGLRYEQIPGETSGASLGASATAQTSAVELAANKASTLEAIRDIAGLKELADRINSAASIPEIDRIIGAKIHSLLLNHGALKSGDPTYQRVVDGDPRYRSQNVKDLSENGKFQWDLIDDIKFLNAQAQEVKDATTAAGLVSYLTNAERERFDKSIYLKTQQELQVLAQERQIAEQAVDELKLPKSADNNPELKTNIRAAQTPADIRRIVIDAAELRLRRMGVQLRETGGTAYYSRPNTPLSSIVNLEKVRNGEDYGSLLDDLSEFQKREPLVTKIRRDSQLWQRDEKAGLSYLPLRTGANPLNVYENDWGRLYQDKEYAALENKFGGSVTGQSLGATTTERSAATMTREQKNKVSIERAQKRSSDAQAALRERLVFQGMTPADAETEVKRRLDILEKLQKDWERSQKEQTITVKDQFGTVITYTIANGRIEAVFPGGALVATVSHPTGDGHGNFTYTFAPTSDALGFLEGTVLSPKAEKAAQAEERQPSPKQSPKELEQTVKMNQALGILESLFEGGLGTPDGDEFFTARRLRDALDMANEALRRVDAWYVDPAQAKRFGDLYRQVQKKWFEMEKSRTPKAEKAAQAEERQPSPKQSPKELEQTVKMNQALGILESLFEGGLGTPDGDEFFTARRLRDALDMANEALRRVDAWYVDPAQAKRFGDLHRQVQKKWFEMEKSQTPEAANKQVSGASLGVDGVAGQQGRVYSKEDALAFVERYKSYFDNGLMVPDENAATVYDGDIVYGSAAARRGVEAGILKLLEKDGREKIVFVHGKRRRDIPEQSSKVVYSYQEPLLDNQTVEITERDTALLRQKNYSELFAKTSPIKQGDLFERNGEIYKVIRIQVETAGAGLHFIYTFRRLSAVAESAQVDVMDERNGEIYSYQIAGVRRIERDVAFKMDQQRIAVQAAAAQDRLAQEKERLRNRYNSSIAYYEGLLSEGKTPILIEDVAKLRVNVEQAGFADQLGRIDNLLARFGEIQEIKKRFKQVWIIAQDLTGFYTASTVVLVERELQNLQQAFAQLPNLEHTRVVRGEIERAFAEKFKYVAGKKAEVEKAERRNREAARARTAEEIRHEKELLVRLNTPDAPVLNIERLQPGQSFSYVYESPAAGQPFNGPLVFTLQQNGQTLYFRIRKSRTRGDFELTQVAPVQNDPRLHPHLIVFQPVSNDVVRLSPGKDYPIGNRKIEITPEGKNNRVVITDLGSMRGTGIVVNRASDAVENLDRRVEREDWDKVRAIFTVMERSIRERGTPEYEKKTRMELVGNLINTITTWDNIPENVRNALLINLIIVRGWEGLLEAATGKRLIVDDRKRIEAMDWLRRFFRVYHHVFYMSIDAVLSKGEQGLVLLGQVEQYTPVNWRGFRTITQVKPIYTNMEGGFKSGINDDEVIVLQEKKGDVTISPKLIAVHEAQHQFDTLEMVQYGLQQIDARVGRQDLGEVGQALLGYFTIQGWEMEYTAYARTMIEIGKAIEEGTELAADKTPAELIGDAFAGDKYLSYYLKAGEKREEHIRGTQELLRKFLGEALNRFGYQQFGKTISPEDTASATPGELIRYLDLVKRYAMDAQNSGSRSYLGEVGGILRESAQKALDDLYIQKLGYVPAYPDVAAIKTVEVVEPAKRDAGDSQKAPAQTTESGIKFNGSTIKFNIGRYTYELNQGKSHLGLTLTTNRTPTVKHKIPVGETTEIREANVRVEYGGDRTVRVLALDGSAVTFGQSLGSAEGVSVQAAALGTAATAAGAKKAVAIDRKKNPSGKGETWTVSRDGKAAYVLAVSARDLAELSEDEIVKRQNWLRNAFASEKTGMFKAFDDQNVAPNRANPKAAPIRLYLSQEGDVRKYKISASVGQELRGFVLRANPVKKLARFTANTEELNRLETVLVKVGTKAFVEELTGVRLPRHATIRVRVGDLLGDQSRLMKVIISYGDGKKEEVDVAIAPGGELSEKLKAQGYRRLGKSEFNWHGKVFQLSVKLTDEELKDIRSRQEAQKEIGPALDDKLQELGYPAEGVAAARRVLIRSNVNGEGLVKPEQAKLKLAENLEKAPDVAKSEIWADRGKVNQLRGVFEGFLKAIAQLVAQVAALFAPEVKEAETVKLSSEDEKNVSRALAVVAPEKAVDEAGQKRAKKNVNQIFRAIAGSFPKDDGFARFVRTVAVLESDRVGPILKDAENAKGKKKNDILSKIPPLLASAAAAFLKPTPQLGAIQLRAIDEAVIAAYVRSKISNPAELARANAMLKAAGLEPVVAEAEKGVIPQVAETGPADAGDIAFVGAESPKVMAAALGQGAESGKGETGDVFNDLARRLEAGEELEVGDQFRLARAATELGRGDVLSKLAKLAKRMGKPNRADHFQQKANLFPSQPADSAAESSASGGLLGRLDDINKKLGASRIAGQGNEKVRLELKNIGNLEVGELIDNEAKLLNILAASRDESASDQKMIEGLANARLALIREHINRRPGGNLNEIREIALAYYRKGEEKVINRSPGLEGYALPFIGVSPQEIRTGKILLERVTEFVGAQELGSGAAANKALNKILARAANYATRLRILEGLAALEGKTIRLVRSDGVRYAAVIDRSNISNILESLAGRKLEGGAVISDPRIDDYIEGVLAKLADIEKDDLTRLEDLEPVRSLVIWLHDAYLAEDAARLEAAEQDRQSAQRGKYTALMQRIENGEFSNVITTQNWRGETVILGDVLRANYGMEALAETSRSLLDVQAELKKFQELPEAKRQLEIIKQEIEALYSQIYTAINSQSADEYRQDDNGRRMIRRFERWLTDVKGYSLDDPSFLENLGFTLTRLNQREGKRENKLLYNGEIVESAALTYRREDPVLLGFIKREFGPLRQMYKDGDIADFMNAVEALASYVNAVLYPAARVKAAWDRRGTPESAEDSGATELRDGDIILTGNQANPQATLVNISKGQVTFTSYQINGKEPAATRSFSTSRLGVVPVFIGRDPELADILNPAPTASGIHAQVYRDPAGRLWSMDLGSTNGTQVLRGQSLGDSTAVLQEAKTNEALTDTVVDFEVAVAAEGAAERTKTAVELPLLPQAALPNVEGTLRSAQPGSSASDLSLARPNDLAGVDINPAEVKTDNSAAATPKSDEDPPPPPPPAPPIAAVSPSVPAAGIGLVIPAPEEPQKASVAATPNQASTPAPAKKPASPGLRTVADFNRRLAVIEEDEKAKDPQFVLNDQTKVTARVNYYGIPLRLTAKVKQIRDLLGFYGMKDNPLSVKEEKGSRPIRNAAELQNLLRQLDRMLRDGGFWGLRTSRDGKKISGDMKIYLQQPDGEEPLRGTIENLIKSFTQASQAAKPAATAAAQLSLKPVDTPLEQAYSTVKQFRDAIAKKFGADALQDKQKTDTVTINYYGTALEVKATLEFIENLLSSPGMRGSPLIIQMKNGIPRPVKNLREFNKAIEKLNAKLPAAHPLGENNIISLKLSQGKVITRSIKDIRDVFAGQEKRIEGQTSTRFQEFVSNTAIVTESVGLGLLMIGVSLGLISLFFGFPGFLPILFSAASGFIGAALMGEMRGNEQTGAKLPANLRAKIWGTAVVIGALVGFSPVIFWGSYMLMGLVLANLLAQLIFAALVTGAVVGLAFWRGQSAVEGLKSQVAAVQPPSRAPRAAPGISFLQRLRAVWQDMPSFSDMTKDRDWRMTATYLAPVILILGFVFSSPLLMGVAIAIAAYLYLTQSNNPLIPLDQPSTGGGPGVGAGTGPGDAGVQVLPPLSPQNLSPVGAALGTAAPEPGLTPRGNDILLEPRTARTPSFTARYGDLISGLLIALVVGGVIFAALGLRIAWILGNPANIPLIVGATIAVGFAAVLGFVGVAITTQSVLNKRRAAQERARNEERIRNAPSLFYNTFLPGSLNNTGYLDRIAGELRNVNPELIGDAAEVLREFDTTNIAPLRSASVEIRKIVVNEYAPGDKRIQSGILREYSAGSAQNKENLNLLVRQVLERYVQTSAASLGSDDGAAPGAGEKQLNIPSDVVGALREAATIGDFNQRLEKYQYLLRVTLEKFSRSVEVITTLRERILRQKGIETFLEELEEYARVRGNDFNADAPAEDFQTREIDERINRILDLVPANSRDFQNVKDSVSRSWLLFVMNRAANAATDNVYADRVTFEPAGEFNPGDWVIPREEGWNEQFIVESVSPDGSIVLKRSPFTEDNVPKTAQELTDNYRKLVIKPAPVNAASLGQVNGKVPAALGKIVETLNRVRGVNGADLARRITPELTEPALAIDRALLSAQEDMPLIGLATALWEEARMKTGGGTDGLAKTVLAEQTKVNTILGNYGYALNFESEGSRKLVVAVTGASLGTAVELVKGNITDVRAEAVALPVNQELGGGIVFASVVDSLIEKNPGLAEDADPFRKTAFSIMPEESVWPSVAVRGAYARDIEAQGIQSKAGWKQVISAVIHGPGAQATSADVAGAVENALRVADQKGLRSIALPAFATGLQGMHPVDSSEAMFRGIQRFRESGPQNLQKIKVVLYDDFTFRAFKIWESLVSQTDSESRLREFDRKLAELDITAQDFARFEEAFPRAQISSVEKGPEFAKALWKAAGLSGKPENLDESARTGEVFEYARRKINAAALGNAAEILLQLGIRGMILNAEMLAGFEADYFGNQRFIGIGEPTYPLKTTLWDVVLGAGKKPAEGDKKRLRAVFNQVKALVAERTAPAQRGAELVISRLRGEGVVLTPEMLRQFEADYFGNQRILETGSPSDRLKTTLWNVVLGIPEGSGLRADDEDQEIDWNQALRETFAQIQEGTAQVQRHSELVMSRLRGEGVALTPEMLRQFEADYFGNQRFIGIGEPAYQLKTTLWDVVLGAGKKPAEGDEQRLQAVFNQVQALVTERINAASLGDILSNDAFDLFSGDELPDVYKGLIQPNLVIKDVQAFGTGSAEWAAMAGALSKDAGVGPGYARYEIPEGLVQRASDWISRIRIVGQNPGVLGALRAAVLRAFYAAYSALLKAVGRQPIEVLIVPLQMKLDMDNEFRKIGASLSPKDRARVDAAKAEADEATGASLGQAAEKLGAFLEDLNLKAVFQALDQRNQAEAVRIVSEHAKKKFDESKARAAQERPQIMSWFAEFADVEQMAALAYSSDFGDQVREVMQSKMPESYALVENGRGELFDGFLDALRSAISGEAERRIDEAVQEEISRMTPEEMLALREILAERRERLEANFQGDKVILGLELSAAEKEVIVKTLAKYAGFIERYILLIEKGTSIKKGDFSGKSISVFPIAKSTADRAIQQADRSALGGRLLYLFTADIGLKNRMKNFAMRAKIGEIGRAEDQALAYEAVLAAALGVMQANQDPANLSAEELEKLIGELPGSFQMAFSRGNDGAFDVQVLALVADLIRAAKERAAVATKA